MTIFNPADPVHNAANAYRGAVKSAFNEAYGLKDSAPNPAKGNEAQIKQTSRQHMRTALAQNHDKSDEIYNAASDFPGVQKTPSTFLDW